MLGFYLAWMRFRKGKRKWLAMWLVCLTPCLLLIISDWFTWYPFTERTSLFVLPCLITLLISSLQLTSLLLLKTRRDSSEAAPGCRVTLRDDYNGHNCRFGPR